MHFLFLRKPTQFTKRKALMFLSVWSFCLLACMCVCRLCRTCRLAAQLAAPDNVKPQWQFWSKVYIPHKERFDYLLSNHEHTHSAGVQKNCASRHVTITSLPSGEPQHLQHSSSHTGSHPPLLEEDMNTSALSTPKRELYCPLREIFDTDPFSCKYYCIYV